jgi:dolichol-phosphate mannosyltransferase
MLNASRCLVVVPTYNEVENITPFVASVLAQGGQFDILVVDDNSPDGTGATVADIAAADARVKLIRRAGKLGLGSAYIDGFRFGLAQGYGYLCQMDADFSHQPRYLPLLLTEVERSADVAIGSRYVEGAAVEDWSWRRRLLSAVGNAYARAVLGLQVRDCTGGFKCFRASALRLVDPAKICSNGYAFQVELNYRCARAGLSIAEVPITFPERTAGKSKMSHAIIAEAALMVLRMRLGSAPLRATPALNETRR